MNLFSQRSSKEELIDFPNVPFKDWTACLDELNTINTWLGGHKITTDGLKKLPLTAEEPLVIAEIGCGGGDNLRAIHRWNKKRQLPIRYIGIDLNSACIDFARKNCASLPHHEFILSDYRKVQFENKAPDIIFSSLFCHHFKNHELVEMLLWLKQNSVKGFFINDLHRHPVAYHLIKWITAAFSGSYLVKHDAPISVLRGFRKGEWQELFRQAGLKNYHIEWKWAFRHLITVKNG
ncbi:MAG: methyltransferase domain-containing protein [Chitinophagaceae bacterium]|nr:methyltransferase domain-containing protein [Chitinophagaceae bacterium]